MKLKHAVLSFLLLLAMILTGCSNQAAITDVVDFDKEADLSLYYVQNEEDVDKETVELKSTLSYVDTDYMMRLKAGAGETSTARKTYAEAPKEWDFVLIDTRHPHQYAEGHINGAINLSAEKFDQEKNKLPGNKNTLIVFYGAGETCSLSADAAEKAQALGYKNVKVYQDGIPAWEKAGNYLAVTKDYVKHHIMETAVTNGDKPAVTILDARSYTAYFESHIPNAVYVDNEDFGKKFLAAIPQNKDTEIITYCSGFDCGNSYALADEIINNGYTNVKVYAGGLSDWKAQNLPTFGTKGSASGFNVSEGLVKRALTPEEFEKKLAEKNVTILDVRSPEEAAAGHFKGSINIPHTKILANPRQIVDKLPQDKNATILIHCKGGVRAGSVVHTVAGLGYNNTFFLDNGITFTEDGKHSYVINRALTPEEFEKKLTTGKVTVLDVRSPEEAAEGHIKGSINIPHEKILEDPTQIIDKLPKDKNATILLHCKAGVRSGKVVDHVANLGYKNTFFLDHAITITEDGKYSFE